MLEKVVQPAIAFAVKDFFEAIRSPRLIAVSILLGVVLVGGSAALAVAMANTPAPDSGQGGVPDPFEVWHNGASGVLTGIAFGLTPVLLPFLPILAASRTLQRDKSQGILQMSLAKPVPPWGLALGKFAGLYGALAIPTVAISAGVALAIQAAAGASVDGGLFTAYAIVNVLLVGLYLVLTLLVGTLLRTEFVAPVAVLIWIGFSAIRQTAILITSRLATILGGKQAATFQVAWTDLATFTGLYQGLLAPSVPVHLGFVIGPGSADGLGPAQAVPWVVLAWLVVMYAVYALSLQRVPSR